MRVGPGANPAPLCSPVPRVDAHAPPQLQLWSQGGGMMTSFVTFASIVGCFALLNSSFRSLQL